MKKIYLAAPLFSEMELQYNTVVADMIRKQYDGKVSVYNPAENESINDKSSYADSIMIANGDNQYLEEADILVAIIDGQVMDVGVAAEIGYFYSMDKPILALYSDQRQGTFGNKDKIMALDDLAESQFSYVNLYVIGLIKQRGNIYPNSFELINAIEHYIYVI